MKQEADRVGRVMGAGQSVRTTPFHAVSAPILQRQKSTSEETRSERLRRQAWNIIKLMSKYVADADKHGHVGITLTVTHNGEELAPAFEMHEPRRPRPSGTIYLSAATVERRYLKPDLDLILQSGPGRWQIVFGRDERGRMVQQTMREIVPRRARPPRSEREELKAIGITHPRERAAKMFNEAEETLKEAGVMLAGIALEEIVLWIVGGAFLRVIGLLGRGAARAFPHLRRAIRLKRAGDIAKAANRIGTAEAAEWSELMRQAQRGVLPKAKKARLNELMNRVETSLGRGSRSKFTKEEVLEEIAEQTSKAPDARALADAGITPKLLKSAYEKHHLLVQQLRKWFRERGVDINKYAVKLSVDEHRLIHNEYKWNAIWKEFKTKNQTASRPLIMSQLKKMMRELGLEGLPFIVYK